MTVKTSYCQNKQISRMKETVIVLLLCALLFVTAENDSLTLGERFTNNGKKFKEFLFGATAISKDGMYDFVWDVNSITSLLDGTGWNLYWHTNRSDYESKVTGKTGVRVAVQVCTNTNF